MSSVSEPLVPTSVLQYTALGPAVSLPPHPSDEELAFDWTLSEQDIRLILTHRGQENLCRFAVQLCVLRKHGRFLPSYAHLSPAILEYLCRQLELPPVSALSGRARDNTESDYQREIARYLGWQPFDAAASTRLRDWVTAQVAQHLYIDDLVEQAEALLRTHQIVLPGPAALARTVTAAHAQAEHLLLHRLAAQLSDVTKREIDRLLGLTAPTDEADAAPEALLDFFRFAAYPPEARAKHILTLLAQYAELRPLHLEGIHHAGMSPELLQRLSTAARTYDAWQLKRFEPAKRYALAAAFLVDAKQRLLDYLVEMHTQFMTEMYREARHAWEQEYRQMRPRVRRGVTTLRELAETVLDLGTTPETPLATVLQRHPAPTVKEAVDDCVRFEHLERYGVLELLLRKYPNFHRYFRRFITLPFANELGSESLLAALALLRQLDTGEIKTLPADVTLAFVPTAWRPRMHDGSASTRRRTWEVAVASELKEALRSGNLFLPESRQHVSFWKLCYDEPTWEQVRPTAFETLQLPTDGTMAVQALAREFHETATRTEQGCASNPYARVEHDRLHVRREPRQPEPPGTGTLRQLVRRALARVRIERLLMDVDAHCGFSRALVPPLQEDAAALGLSPERHYSALMAALVAHGTNLGIATMADSTENITVHMLQHLSRTCLRDETLQRANAAIVNYHCRLPISQAWGDGHRASSDGQRFGVRESSLLATFYPRYFGYYERAVSVYTHLSNQWSVFSTQVISCAEREALYVLDGLLDNPTDLPVRAHMVDTHGYTDQLFGLCYLLGFAFMPRLKKLSSQRLFNPAGSPEEGLFGSRAYPMLDALFSGTVNLNLIAEQWDALVRVAASLKHRIVRAHVVAQRLVNGAASNRLALALTHLGRLVKTIYLLRYLDDPLLRQQVRTQLSRGEARHDLARSLFFADQGLFRSGDYYQMMNRASCLSLLSNAVLVYNTLRIARMLEQAHAQGQTFTPEALAHISPLMYRHVIVNGTYDFSPDGSVMVGSE
jgi:TnpA family transposase